LNAGLRIDSTATVNFEIESGQTKVRGQSGTDATVAHFELAGIAGELRRPGRTGAAAEVSIERMTLDNAPGLLAIAAAMLPAATQLDVAIEDFRLANRLVDQSVGALDAEIAHRDGAVEFSFESRAQSPHQIVVQGNCAYTPAGRCDAEFTLATSQLADLIGNMRLPPEWPAEVLHASGNVSWPGEVRAEFARTLDGRFEIETRSDDPGHQLFATATLDDGDIRLTNVQGTGPEADQVFRGHGRVGLLARDYDLTVDYEQISLASAAVPTPARARLSRAWSLLRGSVARRGWTEPPETRRVQWHGYWDADADNPGP
jgi:hypothetical protein